MKSLHPNPQIRTPKLHQQVQREQLLSRNAERFRGGLVFKAHILLYHSTLGSRVIKKKKKYKETSHAQIVLHPYGNFFNCIHEKYR
jgi:hypothetical protein